MHTMSAPLRVIAGEQSDDAAGCIVRAFCLIVQRVCVERHSLDE